jgi:hypothetical protein
MRKPDEEVREVLCSETGKPMPKIPLWMAGVKVKFVSDEARQKHPTVPGLMDIEPLRRGMGAPGDMEELKDLDAAGAMIDEPEAEFEEAGVEAEDLAEEEYEG